MKRFCVKGKSNNRGSTMVEVLVGFTILVMIIVECMVHIVGLSGEMVKKSKDISTERHILTENMYKKSVQSTANVSETDGFTEISGVTVTLKLRPNEQKGIAATTFTLSNAVVDYYMCTEADLSMIRMRYKE